MKNSKSERKILRLLKEHRKNRPGKDITDKNDQNKEVSKSKD